MAVIFSSFSPIECLPALWLDASDSTTITLNGSNVSNWADKSGNGYDATQGTAGDQPEYNTSGMNGRATVDFDSSNTEFMTFASDDFLDLPATIFVVTEIATQQNQLFISRQKSGSNGGVFVRDESGNIELQIADAGSPFSTGKFTEPAINTPFMISAYSDISNGSYVNIARDGGSFNQSIDSVLNFTNSVSYDAKIGRRADGSESYLDGKIAEVIVYNRVLSTLEINKIETYLSNKWNITI